MSRFTVVVSFLVLTLDPYPPSSAAQNASGPAGPGLIAVTLGDTTGRWWGYIDTAGTVIIAPRFAYAVPFSDGFGRVMIGADAHSGKWGFVDATGRLLGERLFDGAEDFSQGLALVRTGEKWGVINTAGVLVVEPRFDGEDPFSDQRALVELDRKFGYIDTHGALVVPPRYAGGLPFSEGLAAVQIGKKWGFIDTTGHIVIEPQFDKVRSSQFPLALRTAVDGGGSLRGLGYESYWRHQHRMSAFSRGRAVVAIGKKWGYIDRAGRTVIPAQFDDAAEFSEGRAAVMVGDKWGYIDTTGALVIPAQYDDAKEFSGGRAWVISDLYKATTRHGYIDRQGSVDARFEVRQPLAEGLAPVKIDEKWGYVDSTGTVVIPPQFVWASPFVSGVAQVSLPPARSAYINRAGRVIWAERPSSAVAAPAGRADSAALRPDTSGLAGSGPLVERLARFVERLEGAELHGQLGVVAFGATPLLPQLAGADRRVRAYADTHPDDARLLILAARLGRLRWVAEPMVFSRENQPSLDTLIVEHAPLHGYLDRARALEPNNAEAHYWKGRLYGLTFSWRKMFYGFNDPPDSVARRFSAYADSALLFGRRAVDLAPQQVSYREALALYFVFAERPDEAAAVVRDVAGGRHPIYLLLRDWQMLPLPPGATPWPSQTRLYAGMKKEEGWSYAELRVRWYVLATSAAQVETFYKTRWPSLRFFEIQGGEEELPGARALTQFFRMKGATLEPSQRMKDVEQSPDKLPDGFMVGLVEMTNASPEVRSKLPITVGGTFCILSAMNVRRVR